MNAKNLSIIPYYITIPAIVIVINVVGIFLMDQSALNSMLSAKDGKAVLWAIQGALITIWEIGIIVSFWKNFPRRESHFTITLALFILGTLLAFFPSKFLSLYFNSIIPLVIDETISTIIFLSIIISLWTHNLRRTAYWALAFWILLVIGSFNTVITFYNDHFNIYSEPIETRSISKLLR